MAYKEAQGFFWDSSSMAGATTAAVSRIDVFFKSKPTANGNASGINRPGATMFIVPAVNSVPVMDNITTAPSSRLEYDQCISSIDAGIPAKFRFDPPAILTTNKDYCLVMHYDGSETFVLWKDTKGETIVGTSQISAGHPQKDIEKYFNFVTGVPVQIGNNSALSGAGVVVGAGASNQLANSSYSQSNWNSISSSVLKFSVYAARYAFNGDRDLSKYINATSQTPNTAIQTPSNGVHNTATGSVSFTIPSRRYEYCVFDHHVSNTNLVRTGERCFQKRPFYPNNLNPKRISCVSNSTTINCPDNDFNFRDHFLLGGTEDEHIICWSQNHDANNKHRVHIGRVVRIISNSSIQVDFPPTFTNASAYWHKAPVAKVDRISDTYGATGARERMVILRDTSANSSNRFVNNSIDSCSVNAVGSGYTNTDYCEITGFESISGVVEGGYKAIANVVTYANGGIQAIYLSNAGCGFVNTAAINVNFYAANGSSSNGSGCTLTHNVSSVFYSEFLGGDGGGGNFHRCRIIDLDLDECGWLLDMAQPPGSFYTASQRLAYYMEDHANAASGRVTYCDRDDDMDTITIPPGRTLPLANLCRKRRCMPSWSNEWHICYGSNGAISNACGASQNSVVSVPPGTSNASVLIINTVSNGDFSSIVIAPSTTTTTFSKYIVNNDYTNEHTNSGNALAKGIESKVTFANDHFAEDLRVFITTYRPVGTDVQIYARIHNSYDSEAFDDKDWTRLEVKDGANVFSSVSDANTFVEVTYGFQMNPNVQYSLAGTITTQLGNNVLVGTNTTFSSNLAVGDLVKFYQPLFPNTHQVAVVSAITDNTHITLNDVVANNDMIGSGLIIQKLQYPHQAFNNYLGENVVRYYNNSMVPFDTFNSYQLKIVLLSNSDIVVPKVDDLRCVGVSS